MSELEIQVRYKETDKMGRAYHSNYFVWYDMARTEYLREHGCSYKQLEEQGLYFVVSETSNKYIRGLEFDDKVLIKTKMSSLRNVSVEFSYEVFNKSSGDLVSTGWTKLGVVDKNGRITRIPEEVLAKLK